ncbi:MAG TPA: hypothetical protein VHE35_17605 [Kofleriaceae bacterium]|nr:hypothetical protein [Kofleriaceae bacterium]
MPSSRLAASVLALAFAAPLTASSCGDNLTNDPDFQPWILDDLAPADGLSIRTPEFDVAAGQEVQDCYFFQIPADEPDGTLWVDHLQLALNPGSHHMNVFRVGELRNLKPADGDPVDLGSVQGTVIHGGTPGTGECWKSSNWSNWALVANDQQASADHPVLDWKLPDGVATKFTAGEWLMLQIHYVNASTQETPYRGRGGLDLYRSKDGDTMELGTLFATQQNIRICRSNPRPTFQGSCAMPTGTYTVAAVNGHFHSRGKQFDIYTWDGVSSTQPPEADKFYTSTNWAEPPMEVGMNLPLPQGGGIWWTCQYQWQEPAEGCEAVDARDPQHANDCCYTFGPIVETSEHCNVFLYYWPKTADVNCF